MPWEVKQILYMGSKILRFGYIVHISYETIMTSFHFMWNLTYSCYNTQLRTCKKVPLNIPIFFLLDIQFKLTK